MTPTLPRPFSRPLAVAPTDAEGAGADGAGADGADAAGAGADEAVPASGRGATSVPIQSAPAIGDGITLAFSFADDRDTAQYPARDEAQYGGSYGARYDSLYEGPTISAERLRLTIEQELRDGLRRKSYRLVAPGMPADAEVCFRLRAFRYDFERYMWTDNGNGAVVIAVEARRPAFRYATVYRANRPPPKTLTQGVGGGFARDTQMRATLREVLAAAAADSGLDAFLTTRG